MAPVMNRVTMWSRLRHHLQDRGARIKEMKGTTTPEAFFLLAFLSLSLSHVTCAFSFIYKRESRTPHEGHG